MSLPKQSTKPNFWLYYNKASQSHVAGSLIRFGAEAAARANIIQGLDFLKKCNKALQAQQDYDRDLVVHRFALDYIVDSIRILMFFENYMKAELVINNFCVHQVDKSNANRLDLKVLAKRQDEQPITVDEVQQVEQFVIDAQANIVNNAGLKETTIGVNTLLKPKYLDLYAFDDEILIAVKKLNVLRNKLHLSDSIEFELSNQFVDDIERIWSFINGTMSRLAPINKTPK
jgi:hypothetical protein